MTLNIIVITNMKENLEKDLIYFTSVSRDNPTHQLSFCKDLSGIKSHYNDKKVNYLISCSTGVIIPQTIIAMFDNCFNIHPASPQFPGRDPHHFASYHGVERYGATLHYMSSLVDEGTIIKTSLEDLCDQTKVTELLSIANHHAINLFNFLVERLIKGMPLTTSSGEEWGSIKYTRNMFKKMCDVTNCEKKELLRRLDSFHVEGHKNVFIIKEGIKFYYE